MCVWKCVFTHKNVGFNPNWKLPGHIFFFKRNRRVLFIIVHLFLCLLIYVFSFIDQLMRIFVPIRSINFRRIHDWYGWQCYFCAESGNRDPFWELFQWEVHFLMQCPVSHFVWCDRNTLAVKGSEKSMYCNVVHLSWERMINYVK